MPAYRAQYRSKGKSILDPYIADQIALWLENGKLVEWNVAIHGEFARYNMPLLGVVTRNTSGQVLKIRVCTDARELNHGIVADNSPLPNITKLFNDMASNEIFSEYDLQSCFLQFPVDEDSQHKLAIHWEGKTYCFAGAPFGVKHISSHVQRVLQEIFSDMRMPWLHNMWEGLCCPHRRRDRRLIVVVSMGQAEGLGDVQPGLGQA
jgi:hypothetical protein